MANRRIDRVQAKRRLGPDAQVDDKAIVIMPTDPRATDPFLALAEDWFSEPGFEWHPHRGIETVTLVLDGVLEHGDNAGHAGALQAGDLQWMTAGRGIIHRELAFRNEHAHTLQLWLNLPGSKRMVDTRYQDVRAADRPRVELPGVSVDVVSGSVAGARGPAKNHWPIHGSVITLEPKASMTHTLPGDHRAFFFVLDGEVSIGGRRVREGEIAWSDPVPGQPASSSLVVSTADGDAPSRVMVYSGRPIRETVAMGGPFVMNTKAEVQKAYADFHAGTFGQVPRQARLKHL
ncbi:pirin family protein [Longivirga aurantiaca]|uniref:Pirin family protein n=1 Tax=Longivirga aurantiaca TaxID=1837743 RepID=A0ABW1T004_9ACTN